MGNTTSNTPAPKFRVVAKSPQNMKKKTLSLSDHVLASPIKEQLALITAELDDERAPQNTNRGTFRNLFSTEFHRDHLPIPRLTMGRNSSFVSNLSINVNAPLRQPLSPQPVEPMTPPTPALAVVEKPCGRYVHSTCSHKNNLYLFGGYNGHSYLNDLYRFDIIKKEWKLIAGCSSDSNHPDRRSDHHLVYRSATHEIVLFGGWADPSRLSDTWTFNLEKAQWKRLPISNEKKMFENGMTLASQLYHHKSDSMIIFGGQYAGDESNRVFQLSFKENVWYQLLPGGTSSLEPSFGPEFSRVRRHDASSSSQQPANGEVIKNVMPEARENTTAVWYQDENYLLIYGGWADGRCLNDMWLFNMHTHSWTEVKYENDPNDEIPQPRGGHAAVMINDRFLYVYGGFHNPNYLNDMWVFDMDHRRWYNAVFSTRQSDHATPTGSWFHTMNLLSENNREIPSIVLFGGEDCNNGMIEETLIIQPDDMLRKYWYPNHSYRRLQERIGGKIGDETETMYSDMNVICQS